MKKSLLINDSVFEDLIGISDNKFNYTAALILDNCKDTESFLKRISELGFKKIYENFSVVYYDGNFDVSGSFNSLVVPFDNISGICIVNHSFGNSHDLAANSVFKIDGAAGIADIYNGCFHKRFITDAYKAFCNSSFVIGKDMFVYDKCSFVKCRKYTEFVLNSVKYDTPDKTKEHIENVLKLVCNETISVEECIFVINSIYETLCNDYNFNMKETVKISLFDFSKSQLNDKTYEIVSLAERIFENSGRYRSYKYKTVIADVIEYVNNNFINEISLKDVAEKFNLKPGYLSILFKKVYECSFTEYVTGLRMEKAKDMLKNTSLSVGEIYDRVGYTDYYSFIKAFKRCCGVSPTVYRKNN